jgi:hypothetical protein
VTILLFEVALSIEAAVVGALAASRSHKLATALSVPMLGLVLLKLIAGHVPAAEARLLPFDWYPFVAGWWYLVPAMFLCGAGLGSARASLLKRDVILVLAGLLLLRTGASAWESRNDHAALRGRVDERGVCKQTSGYSCGPAAAASFLHLHGVESTEREMALLCATRSGLGGTSECGLVRGLRRKLPGRAVRILTCRFEELPCPCMVSLRRSFLAFHAVVVADSCRSGVRLIDPASGVTWMAREAFEKVWTGAAITLEGP